MKGKYIKVRMRFTNGMMLCLHVYINDKTPLCDFIMKKNKELS